ncbi:twin-arginine translocation signal domain-containing protein [Chitinophaga rhizosphaerae]|uniref:twin-arginine translocation signal domain-containing protein n=1 Tax=Chitinophaga rhizosphaerae TaxID=1864947 RepID=UPI000F8064F3|nr:twin-arginine translocation signal domain-containing protein [Chitinophaga rhizosphaerae]
MSRSLPNAAPSRRDFLGQAAMGAAALGLGWLASPLPAVAAETAVLADAADEWFKKIKGKHRLLIDSPRPHGIFPFAWPKVFLITNSMTGTPEKDCSVVVVLRHDAIPYAMKSDIWSKYKFGEMFKADDPATQAPSLRNPFWQPGPNDFSVPGVGPVEIGIDQLQNSGVMFCVCNMAITVYSAVAATSMGLDAELVRSEWLAGVLPGIQVVPSGVWAIGRAQEKGCAYCFAG